MLRQGVALAPGAYEILFTSLAHSDEDLDRTIACAGEAAQIAAKT
jgi:glutamate-1-semialdehyde 2,1-aminomutase